MVPTNLAKTQDASNVALAIPLVWGMELIEAPREHSPFEIDDGELEALLGDQPEVAIATPEELAARAEAEVPSLWLL